MKNLSCVVVAFFFMAFSQASVAQLSPASQKKNPPSLGDVADDFELETIEGTKVSLAAKRKDGPVVVVVLRGFPGYQCPLCTRQVGAFIQAADQFKAKKASVIFVYPGPEKSLGEKAKEFISKSTLPTHFTLVMDPNFKFTELYKLRWNAPNETAYPSTFVMDSTGKITFAKISQSHGDRSDVKAVIAAIP